MSDNHLIDWFLGGASVTAIAWMRYVDPYFAFVMLVGGVILLVLRIMLAWRQWRRGQ